MVSNMPRNFSLLDEYIMQLDKTLRLFHNKTVTSERPYPAQDTPTNPLSVVASRQAGRLMRVNHTGEVCAQALYQGQALTARDQNIRHTLRQAAAEEMDHLVWCEQRLQELNGRASYLNPLWYIGSLAIGLAAGIAGDKWSLGFLAETERQVSEHLAGHLQQLPIADNATRQVVEQMKHDEQQHAHTAVAAGAAELPLPIKFGMRLASKAMTKIAYYI